MCPFSHGMLLAFVIYLQFLNGEGATISSVHASDQKITTFQSTQLLFYPPRQMTMERKHVDQMSKSDRQQTEKGEDTKRLRQANGVVPLHHKHREFDHQKQREFDHHKQREFDHHKQREFDHHKQREFDHHKQREFDHQKHSLTVTPSVNQHDPLPSSAHMQKIFQNADKTDFKNAVLGKQRQNSLHFIQMKHFRKLKAAHLKSCEVCRVKFDHKRRRPSRQNQVLRRSPYDNRTKPSHDHKTRSHRTQYFTPTYFFNPAGIYSRKKRSPKRNKHLKVNKNNKNVNGSKESVKKLRSLTRNQNRFTAAYTGMLTKTTDGASASSKPTSHTPYTATRAAARSHSTNTTSHTPSASGEILKGNTPLMAGRKGVEMSGSRFGVQSSEERGTVSVLESNRSEQKINASTLDSDVDKDMYLGLDGKLVNVTIFVAILKEKEFQRQLNRAAQWAYMCLVMLMCLMMWMIWCLGGLERCRYRPDNQIRFTDLQPHVTVNDVLQKRRQYLPMFNEPEWEEVLMCNRGSDP